MKIAIEGCCHGELDQIYEVLEQVRARNGTGVDLLICCGDFQAVRNVDDLATMACPQKYRAMNSFYKYYSGEKVAPVLTLFIGGNHEASNHLWELSYGGWVAPRIYYLGNAGVVQFGGVRIAGLSGIFKRHDYGKGRFECPPYSESTKRSAYHVRSCDVFRLKQLTGSIDIMLSHDWPVEICHYGDTDQLIRTKPFFAEEIADNTLGSPPAMDLLKLLKPLYWFSAHLHVKFAALYPHEGGDKKHTKFLALDKCLPRRRFLQILDIPSPADHVTSPPDHVISFPDHVTPSPNHVTRYRLEYDREWLAIVKSTDHLLTSSSSLWLPPSPLTDSRHCFTPTSDELAEVDSLFDDGDLTVPDNFSQTVAAYVTGQWIDHHAIAQPKENPQTTEFCKKLGIPNRYRPAAVSSKSHDLRRYGNVPTWGATAPGAGNPDEIPLEDEGAEEEESHDLSCHENPDEIKLSDEDDVLPEALSPSVATATQTRGTLSLPPPALTPPPVTETTPTTMDPPLEVAVVIDSAEGGQRKVVIKRRNIEMYQQSGGDSD